MERIDKNKPGYSNDFEEMENLSQKLISLWELNQRVIL